MVQILNFFFSFNPNCLYIGEFAEINLFSSALAKESSLRKSLSILLGDVKKNNFS